MATSESAPRAAVALKEPARKSAASIGTLRIMGLLLSSASTGAPGRLDSEVNEGDPIFERWTSLHIVITRGGAPLDCFFFPILFLRNVSRDFVTRGRARAPHVRVARHAQSLYAPGLRPAAKAPRPGARRGADAAGRLQCPKEGGSATQVSQRNADPNCRSLGGDP